MKINRLLISLLFVFQIVPAEAILYTITPGSGALQAQINRLSEGDTLLLMPGVYKEQGLHINRRIVLKGSPGAILDGMNKYEILVIEANGVIVEGLLFRNGGYSSYNDLAALRILNAREVVVQNNQFEHTFFGIFSQHGRRCTIRGNTLHSNAVNEKNYEKGIHCWKSDSMLIEYNTISGHRDGIYFEFVTNSVIRYNYSFNNIRYGLHFMFSNNDQYVKNRFSENGAGVAVMFSHHVNMLGNQFEKNWGAASYGLLLKEISDGEIKGNHFFRNSAAIFMEGTNRMKVSDNDFLSNGWALKIQASCDGNSFLSNNFQSNSFDVATNGTLVLNEFHGNYWDVYEGFDLGRDGTGDVPFRPLSIYAMVVERNPTALMLFRSFMVLLMDRSEKLLPGITPENLKDDFPKMHPVNHPTNSTQ